jgi:hypothetical protein
VPADDSHDGAVEVSIVARLNEQLTIYGPFLVILAAQLFGFTLLLALAPAHLICGQPWTLKKCLRRGSRGST